MTLIFHEKNVYGRILIFPDEAIKPQVEALLRRKTVKESQLNALAQLGCDVQLIELPTTGRTEP